MTARGGAALSILCEALVQQILVHNSVKIKNKHQFIANKPFTFLPFPKPRQHTYGGTTGGGAVYSLPYT